MVFSLHLAQWPVPSNVYAGISMRMGGYSQPPWNSLNLGDHVADSLPTVQKNRAQFEAQLRMRPLYLKQVHGTDVVCINNETMARKQTLVADAAWTDQTGIACVVGVADCLPVLFYGLCAQEKALVAAAHAGWRGLCAGVLENTVQALVQAGIKPRESLVWMGPCIGPSAFEVGAEVREAFVQVDAQANLAFTPKPCDSNAQKYLANLQLLARQRLEAIGIAKENIFGNDGAAPWCTYAQANRYFSYRRDGVTGRMQAFIGLR